MEINFIFEIQAFKVSIFCCCCICLDIQLCPSRTDDYIPKLYYETNRFTAFDQLWVMKAKVIGNEKSATRSFAYQLILKGIFFASDI